MSVDAASKEKLREVLSILRNAGMQAIESEYDDDVQVSEAAQSWLGDIVAQLFKAPDRKPFNNMAPPISDDVTLPIDSRHLQVITQMENLAFSEQRSNLSGVAEWLERLWNKRSETKNFLNQIRDDYPGLRSYVLLHPELWKVCTAMMLTAQAENMPYIESALSAEEIAEEMLTQAGIIVNSEIARIDTLIGSLMSRESGGRDTRQSSSPPHAP